MSLGLFVLHAREGFFDQVLLLLLDIEHLHLLERLWQISSYQPAYLGLNGIFSDELVDVNGLGLSDAVAAIDSLALNTLLPPWVHEVDVVGDSQVQAQCTRLER